MSYEEDLIELDRIWPLGKKLLVPAGGTVVVAGAFKGRYMDYVATRFKQVRVIGFEPQVAMANEALARLWRHGPAATVHPVGLGVHDCLVMMSGSGTDGCKVCDNNSGTAVRLRGFAEVMEELGSIDLFICNMEGYEVMLLPYLCASRLIQHVGSIAVQFHSDNPNTAVMLSDHYGEPVYYDFPTWCYWG